MSVSKAIEIIVITISNPVTTIRIYNTELNVPIKFPFKLTNSGEFNQSKVPISLRNRNNPLRPDLELNREAGINIFQLLVNR